MIHARTAAAAALAAALAFPEGPAMADMVLCSPLEGRLLRADGAPAPEVRLVRSWIWSFTGRKGADETVTDAEGRFAFPVVTGSSFMASVVPHETRVVVNLEAEGANGRLTLLSLDKRDYELGSEARAVGAEGDTLRLSCDLDAEPGTDGVYWGTCRLAP